MQAEREGLRGGHEGGGSGNEACLTPASGQSDAIGSDCSLLSQA